MRPNKSDVLIAFKAISLSKLSLIDSPRSGGARHLLWRVRNVGRGNGTDSEYVDDGKVA